MPPIPARLFRTSRLFDFRQNYTLHALSGLYAFSGHWSSYLVNFDFLKLLGNHLVRQIGRALARSSKNVALALTILKNVQLALLVDERRSFFALFWS